MAPAGTHTNPNTPRVRNGEPQPAPIATPEPASSRRDLTSWWRQFSKRPAKKDDDKGTTLLLLLSHVEPARLSLTWATESQQRAATVSATTCLYLSRAITDCGGRT